MAQWHHEEGFANYCSDISMLVNGSLVKYGTAICSMLNPPMFKARRMMVGVVGTRGLGASEACSCIDAAMYKQ